MVRQLASSESPLLCVPVSRRVCPYRPDLDGCRRVDCDTVPSSGRRASLSTCHMTYSCASRGRRPATDGSSRSRSFSTPQPLICPSQDPSRTCRWAGSSGRPGPQTGSPGVGPVFVEHDHPMSLPELSGVAVVPDLHDDPADVLGMAPDELLAVVAVDGAAAVQAVAVAVGPQPPRVPPTDATTRLVAPQVQPQPRQVSVAADEALP